MKNLFSKLNRENRKKDPMHLLDNISSLNQSNDSSSNIVTGTDATLMPDRQVSRRTLIIFAALFAAIGAVLIIRSFAATTTPAAERVHKGGLVNYAQPAQGREANWDPILADAYADSTGFKQQWLRDHYWRMRTYDSGFIYNGNNYTNMYPSSWNYRGAYTIYPSNVTPLQDSMILRNKDGRKLYIDYFCSNGACTQYAADISKPVNRSDGITVWREYFIDENKRIFRDGKYKGVFVDDVNYNMHVSDGYITANYVNGVPNSAVPIDSNTGAPMTFTNWQKYMAETMEDLRRELDAEPTLCNGSKCEIVHNTVFYDQGGRDNPYVKRGIAAADYMEVERGFGDNGLSAGTGTFGVENLLNYADYVQSEAADNDADTTPNKKRGVVLDGQSKVMGKEYSLAGYYLVSNGTDSMSDTDEGYPAWPTEYQGVPFPQWWNGYDTDLGDPKAKWYKWTPAGSSDFVYRRDFQNGFVMLNPPDSSIKTINLEANYKRVKGDGTRPIINSIQLGYPQQPAGQAAPNRACNIDPCGVVLLNEGFTPPPPPPVACADGQDNDGDGKIDYPADPGCISSTDTDETDAAPPVSGTNLAINKPVTASSEESATGDFAAIKAVDGNASTRWSSAFSDPQSIQIDLGSTYSINQVILKWEAAYAQAYKIQVSDDATNWTDISATTTGDGGIDDLTLLTGTGRYIRMAGTVRGTPYGYSLYEFEVYGTPSGVTTPEVVTINDATVGTSTNQFEFAGSWIDSRDSLAYNGDEHYTNDTNAYYQVRFNGTQAKVYTTLDPAHGKAAVSIDGGAECVVDSYSATRSNGVVVYVSPALNSGAHTLKVRVYGTGYIVADRVDINSTTAPATPTNCSSSIDTTPPTATITDPPHNATVAGTKTVVATASDNSGTVAGIQFKLDGANVGTEDTVAPYNYSINTVTLANGSHTITAVARDNSGNLSPVPLTPAANTNYITITVNNSDTTAPSAPTSFSATATSSTSVNLAWSGASDNVDVTGYFVYRYLTANGASSAAVIANLDNVGSYTDNTALADTNYTYYVIAKDAAGNPSSPSVSRQVTTPPNPVVDTTLPSVPANLAAVAVGPRQVNLTWTPSTDSGGSGLKEYRIYRNGTLVATVPATNCSTTGCSWGENKLRASTNYSYTIEAVDGAGNKSPRTASVSVTTPRPGS